jgi:hypothetical protein
MHFAERSARHGTRIAFPRLEAMAVRNLTFRLPPWRLAPVATALLFLPLMTAMTAQQPPASPAAQPAIRFRSGVDIVRLSVTARDAGGQLVHDLRP